VAQSLPENVECFLILDIIAFDIRLTAPKVGLQDTATPHPDLQTPVTEVIQHADFFDQAQGMMQWQHIDTGGEP